MPTQSACTYLAHAGHGAGNDLVKVCILAAPSNPTLLLGPAGPAGLAESGGAWQHCLLHGSLDHWQVRGAENLTSTCRASEPGSHSLNSDSESECVGAGCRWDGLHVHFCLVLGVLHRSLLDCWRSNAFCCLCNQKIACCPFGKYINNSRSIQPASCQEPRLVELSSDTSHTPKPSKNMYASLVCIQLAVVSCRLPVSWHAKVALCVEELPGLAFVDYYRRRIVTSSEGQQRDMQSARQDLFHSPKIHIICTILPLQSPEQTVCLG